MKLAIKFQSIQTETIFRQKTFIFLSRYDRNSNEENPEKYFACEEKL